MPNTFETATAQLQTCVTHLLRDDPDVAVPLTRLHARLVARLGRADVGTRDELRRRLARRPDLFLILEAPEPAWHADAWDAASRRAYRHAFHSLGIEPGPRIALARLPANTGPVAGSEYTMHRLETSLLTLWMAERDDPAVHAALFEAVLEARELRAALEL